MNAGRVRDRPPDTTALPEPEAPADEATASRQGELAPGRVRFEVTPGETGQRLDRCLAARLELPRNRVQSYLREGRVLVDARVVRAAHALAAGEHVEVELPAAAPAPILIAEPGDLTVLHEDDDLVVLDKPAGLVVHPGAGRASGTLSHRLVSRYPELASVGHPLRPGIVHRLDRDTSGVMVVARSERAYRALSADFAARRVGKLYLALVWGRIGTLVVDRPIGRHARDRKRMAVRAGGRAALTELAPLGAAAGGSVSALAVRLHTGRTHQIRVHLQDARHPLLGDPVYGEARWKGLPAAWRAVARDFPRCALHAWVLVLRHPAHGAICRFEAPVPADLSLLWSELGGDPKVLRAPELDVPSLGARRMLEGEFP
jgi:23S rRNA pseudouridine1911/1915/1917 synthase